MNGLPVSVELKNQNARPFLKCGIVFENFGVGNALNNVLNRNGIISQLFIAMHRDQNILLRYQFLYRNECFT